MLLFLRTQKFSLYLSHIRNTVYVYCFLVYCPVIFYTRHSFKNTYQTWYSVYLFNFNWRIITLQYCDSFCHTSTWISRTYTYVPSLLNCPLISLLLPPLWVVTEHQLWILYIIQQIPTGFFTYGTCAIMYMFQYYSLNVF